jgi:hypothetical protein
MTSFRPGAAARPKHDLHEGVSAALTKQYKGGAMSEVKVEIIRGIIFFGLIMPMFVGSLLVIGQLFY